MKSWHDTYMILQVKGAVPFAAVQGGLLAVNWLAVTVSHGQLWTQAFWGLIMGHGVCTYDWSVDLDLSSNVNPLIISGNYVHLVIKGCMCVCQSVCLCVCMLVTNVSHKEFVTRSQSKDVAAVLIHVSHNNPCWSHSSMLDNHTPPCRSDSSIIVTVFPC